MKNAPVKKNSEGFVEKPRLESPIEFYGDNMELIKYNSIYSDISNNIMAVIKAAQNDYKLFCINDSRYGYPTTQEHVMDYIKDNISDITYQKIEFLINNDILSIVNFAISSEDIPYRIKSILRTLIQNGSLFKTSAYLFDGIFRNIYYLPIMLSKFISAVNNMIHNELFARSIGVSVEEMSQCFDAISRFCNTLATKVGHSITSYMSEYDTIMNQLKI